MTFLRRWLLIFAIYTTGCTSQETFISTNTSLLSSYDQMVCGNEPSCSLVNHFSIPDDRRSLDRRNCMCDVDCVTYRDCCYDSPTYKRNDQLQPQIFYCPPTPTLNVYMKTNCPATWPRDNIASMCEKSMEPLQSEDLLLILPVTNNETAITYGNMYCAMCHNDDHLEPWLLEPTCWPIESPTQPPPPAQYNTYPNQLPVAVYVELRPSANPYFVTDPFGKTILDLYLYQDGLNGAYVRSPYNLGTYPLPGQYLGPPLQRRRRALQSDTNNGYHQQYDSKEIWKYVHYDSYSNHFVSSYNGQQFVCDITPKLPDKLKPATRTCIPQLVDSCLPGSDPVQIQYCREFTSIVYNKYSKRVYRNKYCAFCNNEVPTYLTGCLEKSPEEDVYHKHHRNHYTALSGGVNPCSRIGAAKELNCPNTTP